MTAARTSAGVALRQLRRLVLRRLPAAARVRVTALAIRARRAVRARGRGQLVDLSDHGAVLIIALGVEPTELGRCVEAVLSARGERTPAPVLLTDCDDFALLRASGVPFEYVPPSRDWQRAIGTGYDEFVGRRRSRLAKAYGVREVVAWDGDGALVRAALRRAVSG